MRIHEFDLKSDKFWGCINQEQNKTQSYDEDKSMCVCMHTPALIVVFEVLIALLPGRVLIYSILGNKLHVCSIS